MRFLREDVLWTDRSSLSNNSSSEENNNNSSNDDDQILIDVADDCHFLDDNSNNSENSIIKFNYHNNNIIEDKYFVDVEEKGKLLALYNSAGTTPSTCTNNNIGINNSRRRLPPRLGACERTASVDSTATSSSYTAPGGDSATSSIAPGSLPPYSGDDEDDELDEEVRHHEQDVELFSPSAGQLQLFFLSSSLSTRTAAL
jgi:hypothetical protein